ncbi:MAG TPA: hypothetical protein VK387_00820 [Thermoleophilaceae bacterium]|nr:hypothetical protein [Thermoleophilaceae bacterium]
MTVARAEPGGQVLRRGGGERAERGYPVLGQARRDLRPNPGEETGRAVGEAVPRLLDRQAHEPVRLVGVGGDLGHELAGSEADRAAEARALAYGCLDPARRDLRLLEIAQVEVRLVEADDLDPLDVLAHDRDHLARARDSVGNVGKSGSRKTALGHSRRARAAGVAEKIPYLRAS